MKHLVQMTNEAYEYFNKRLIQNDGALVEDWRRYCSGMINKYDKKHWEELYNKVAKECEFRSSNMLTKIINGDIELECEPKKRFVFYKVKLDKGKRYYGDFIETTFSAGASKYEEGNIKDEEQMKALETLGWIKEEYKG